jgi:O-antigen/teichoic acid export membrane protein
MQGIQNFRQLSFNSTIDPIFRLGLGILFVMIGWGINGAIGATVIGAMMAYLFGLIPLKRFLKKTNETIDTSSIKGYSWPVLMAMTLSALLINIDVFLVKHFAENISPVGGVSGAQLAGLYAALSVLGKIIFFLAGPIVGVMFPMIAELSESHQKHYPIFLNALLIIIGISSIILICYFVFPSFIVKILYGKDYLPISHYLGRFGIMLFLYSLVFTFINYFLSIKKTAFIYPLAIISLSEAVGLWFFHQNFNQIINLLSIVMGLLLTIFILLYFIPKKNQFIYAISHRSRLQ